MNDIYANDPTPPITEKQQQELAASLDAAGSAVPLRPSDLHTRTMVPRIREQITKWTAQGPSAAGIPKTHGPLEKIDVIPGILAVPTFDEDAEKIQFAKKILFRGLRSLPPAEDAAPWSSREAASAVIDTQFAPIVPTPAVRWTDVTSDRAMSLLAFQGLAAHRLSPLDDDACG